MSVAEMDTDSAGNVLASYEQLGGRRLFNTNNSNRHQHTRDASPENSQSQLPEHDNDRKNIVYFTLLTAGIGFVLPYNSFIMAADYWQERFKGKNVAMDMTMIYIIVAFATVLLNNVFLTLVPYRVRVAAGYAVSFTTLVFVGVCEVAWHMFNATTAYSVNLVAVSLVAVGCTIQQSSFYGFASMLPKKYPQAVMVGESLAGFLVSSNRVITKLIIENNRISTMIFFLTSSAYIAISYVLHSVTIESPFVQYHLRACAKIVLRPYDSQLEETSPPSNSAAHETKEYSQSDSLATADAQMHALSFSNPVYDLSNPTPPPTATTTTTTTTTNVDGEFTNIPIKSESTAHVSPNPGVAFKVEHHLTPTGCSSAKYSNFRRGLNSRITVAHLIYPYMCCIALAYCVTLSLYPGLESEIKSCKLKSWMPVLLMFTFNTSDMLGKILAAIPYAWSRRQLTLMSSLRTLLIPLLLMCCAPRERPVISGEAMSFFFTAALGLSNGVAGSLPMMLAPSKVPASLKETAGNMMTLSYTIGLTLGSMLGYMFEAILGPPLDQQCPQFPFAPPPPVQEINTTVGPGLVSTTSTTTTAATTLLSIYSNWAAINGSTSTTTTTARTSTALASFLTALATSSTTTAAPTYFLNGNNSTFLRNLTQYAAGHNQQMPNGH